MLNFIRRLRWTSLVGDDHNGKPARKYILYAVGEILLIMIGILLAVQINKWSEGKKEKQDELQFYQNFKRQIREDQHIIKGSAAYNENYRQQFQKAIQIIEESDRSQTDTLGYIAMKMTKYSDFDRPSNIYQSIVNSGEIRLIHNKDIIEKIQILEETYNYFNRLENIHYDLVTSIVPELITLIKYADRTVQDPDRLFDYRFQNILITAENIMNEKDVIYHKAISQIDEISELIDLESLEDK